MTARERIFGVTDSYCDRCGAGGPMFAVAGDLEGSWAYCGPCALITARVLEALEGGDR